jgi:hypothetical protein
VECAHEVTGLVVNIIIWDRNGELRDTSNRGGVFGQEHGALQQRPDEEEGGRLERLLPSVFEISVFDMVTTQTEVKRIAFVSFG